MAWLGKFLFLGLIGVGALALDRAQPGALARPEVLIPLGLGAALLGALLFSGGGDSARDPYERRGGRYGERRDDGRQKDGRRDRRHDPRRDPYGERYDDRSYRGGGKKHKGAKAAAGAAAYGGYDTAYGDAPRRRRRRSTDPVLSLMAWVALFAGGAALVEYGPQIFQNSADRAAWTGPISETDATEALQEAVLTKDRDGHFVAEGVVNGTQIDLLIDTGATDVVLPYEAARDVGVDMARLRFIRRAETANGQTMLAPITLSEIRVGGVVLQDVRAAVTEPGKLSSPLLGMSFLGRLSEVSFRGDTLTLRR